MDARIVQLGHLAREFGFCNVWMVTNGDLLTKELAAELDGVFSNVIISPYEDRSEVSSWFTKTKLKFTDGRHRITHFSGLPGLDSRVEAVRTLPCLRARLNFIVNHQGYCLLCCEEMVPHFDLGNVYESSLRELWFSKRRSRVVTDLQKPGGRLQYPYCMECPSGPIPAGRYSVN